jgi:hypothetical protein
MLPPPVQNAIRAQVGGAEIADIQRDASSGVVTVYFRNAAAYAPLRISPDGSVLGYGRRVAVGAAGDDLAGVSGTASSGIALADLPGEVHATVRKNWPGAEIIKISKETWGNQVTYIISFKDEARYPRVYVRSDGTIMSHGPK